MGAYKLFYFEEAALIDFKFIPIQLLFGQVGLQECIDNS